jgi:hypothetical protein
MVADRPILHAAALAFAALCACTGEARLAGGAAGPSGPTGPTGPYTVTVHGSATRIQVGTRATFDATVAGTTDQRVLWSVEAAGGHIDPTGVFTASTTPGAYHVRATSAVSATSWGELAITVFAPVKITISPKTASVVVGTTYLFRASVQNATDTTVQWSVSPATGCGSVTTGGLYTAPGTPGLTCTVTAQSHQDLTQTDSATVTTRAAPPATVTHPALLLDATTLARLAAKATANDPAWLALKAECDSFLSGTVSPPSGPVTDLPNIPTSNDYQGLDYLQFAQDAGLCYQVEKTLGNTTLANQYGQKAVAIAMSMTDPARQYGHNDPSGALQLEDDGWSMRTYPMALLYAYDWAYDQFTAAQRSQVVTEINSFIDTYDRGWAYPVITGGQVTGAVFWGGPSGSGTSCSVNANGGGGSGATCTVTRTNGRVSAINITSPGSGYNGTGRNSPMFNIGGATMIPYGGGGSPFSPGTFDSNYYAPYYAVKGFAALLTADDNARAAEYWTDWTTRVHGGIVQPWYAAYRVGGGHPEGFPNYGERAVELMSLPTILVDDVKGTDLIHAAAPYQFPLDALDYMFYATWPSLDFVYDEGVGYYATNPPYGYAQGSFFRYLYGFAKRWGHPRLAQFHRFTKDLLAVRSTSESAAEDFLWWDAGDADAPYNTLPLSYLAQGATQGAGHVFARSDWTTSAVWMAYNGGVYLDNSGQSEEKFGKGGLEVVRGGKPLIVLQQWLNHASSGGDVIYADDFGGNPRLRRYYNTFQVFHIGAPEDTNQMSNQPPAAGSLTGEYGTARTAVTTFDDGGTYVLATSRWLEDEYRNWGGNAHGQCPVASWTRSVLYLRPTSQIVVYDRTGTCYYSTVNAIDQQMVFMTPAAPVANASTPAGTTRYDVTYQSTFMGSITSVLPASADPTVTNVSNLNVNWRIAFRPHGCTATGCSPDPGASLRWLTVIDASTSAANVASAAGLTATGMTGVLLTSPTARTAALFNAGAAGTTVSGTITYSIPPNVPTSHVLSELPAGAHYAITDTAGAIAVTPNAGGTYVSSSKGVLVFRTDASNVVTP